ncbi:MAG: PQQ-dependent sugar dehydrogenase [Chloroflexota bacterium]|nr:PQQ-dependent sugar dehydrogenase [Chloroflexota bacterium]
MVVLRRVCAWFAALVLVTGCGPTSTSVAPSAATSRPPGSPVSPAAGSVGSPGVASPVGGSPTAGPFDPARVIVTLEHVATIAGAPLSVTAAPGDTARVFVTDKRGRVWIVRDGKPSTTPFLDISARVSGGSEQGLLGFALHPGYLGDPRFVVDYTNPAGDTVVSEWRVSSGNPDRADAGSERILLTVKQPFANHNGGAVVFGPDGLLYISLGDGGSGGDPQGNGQRLDTLLAKLLRIAVDTTTAGKPYGIPAGNPFVGTSGARPEIYLTGLRNPWRMSFDRGSGDLWIGDVGQDRFEEIDVVRAGSAGGQNFGWNRMEGNHCYPSGASCDKSGLSPPVAEYAHAFGCSVTGGNVYRGNASPALVGSYLFADYCSGNVWAMDARADRAPRLTIVAQTGRPISSFGEDANGELLATDLTGALLRVVGTAR